MCARVIDHGWSIDEAASAAGISRRTAFKWLARFRCEGSAGLSDRTSRPIRSPRRLAPDRVRAITSLRGARLSGAAIADVLEIPRSTVGQILRRHGLNRLPRLGPTEPPNRYERRHPGELLHIDVKKLARIVAPGHRIHGVRQTRIQGAGWEFVHVCVDDATRIAYVEVLADERAVTAIGFLHRAVAHYRRLGITVERVMTDNGSAYKSHLHARVCRRMGLRHLRTRPYRPQTNGKAERFIRTMLEESLYAAVYANSAQRELALHDWLDFYNRRRRHSSLGRISPMERLAGLNNVCGSYN
jgi:transposase InsO family protein